MAKPSKIDRLPLEIRDLIGDLRSKGWTLDQIMDRLRELDGVDPLDMPSRSGLGRHIQGLDKLAERVHQSRSISEALVRKLGDAPESRQARLNIELMHSAVMDLFLSIDESAEGGTAVINSKSIHDLAKALDHLSRAQDRDADHIIKLQKQFVAKTKTAAAQAIEQSAREMGLSAQTVTSIKAMILGVKVGEE